MLTFQYLPFTEIAQLDSEKRITKLLNIVKKNKIVLMQGRLEAVEEAKLIERTTREVSKEFKGIELCTIYPNQKKKKNKKEMASQIKQFIARKLVGDRDGLTIIGPASVVKEIKKNPDKIELLTHAKKRNGRK